MTRLLAIDADLSEPPSSPTVFREVTMISSSRGYDVLAIAPRAMLDSYHGWFRRYGLWDYLTDLLTPDEIVEEHLAVHIGGEGNARLTVINLHDVLAHIPVVKG